MLLALNRWFVGVMLGSPQNSTLNAITPADFVIFWWLHWVVDEKKIGLIRLVNLCDIRLL